MGMDNFNHPGGESAFWQQAAWASGEPDVEGAPMAGALDLWGESAPAPTEEEQIKDITLEFLAPEKLSRTEALNQLKQISQRQWARKVMGEQDVPEMGWAFMGRVDVLYELLPELSADDLRWLLLQQLGESA